MVIVDTSVLIDFLAGRETPQTAWMKQRSNFRRIAMTSLILSEVLQGIRSDDLFTETLNTLNRFAIFETGSQALAVASARNYRALRRMGVTIRSTIDSLVATFCIEEGHFLLYNDRDFDAFATHLGLQVIDPHAIAPN